MAAIFAHSSSGPVSLRTLTLGVLIVSGGTLAALPFRRYHAIPDSSTTPVHATGPTNSALQMGATSPPSEAAFAPPQMAEAVLPGSILATHSENFGVSGMKPENPNSPDRVSSLANTMPSHGAPLTYEDLVLPIQMPDIVQRRFNATAAVKSIQMEKERVAEIKKSRMEPMTATSSETPNPKHASLFAGQTHNEAASRSVLQPTGNQPPGRQTSGAITNATTQQTPSETQPTLAAELPPATDSPTGSLASTNTFRNPPANQPAFARSGESGVLPATTGNDLQSEADSSSRARHWIRQPD